MGNFVLQMIVLVLVALLAGCYFNEFLVLLPAQKQLSASSYIEIEQANTRLGTIRYRLLIFTTLLSQLLLLTHDVDQPVGCRSRLKFADRFRRGK